ncbi:glycosyltransferase, partial [Prochlorococcus sp. AH-736-K09]|nr:glycosyltransferase [Prochlorococcus sp. AH-736-K09]
MKNIIIRLSTPNNRGIHIYAKQIYKMLKGKFKANLFIPKKINGIKELFLLKQILWELLPLKIKNSRKIDLMINVYPRLSVDNLLNIGNKSYKKGIVICDYMQCIKLRELFQFKTYNKFNIFEIFKRSYHSLFFYLSKNLSDFYIFISNTTYKEFKSWNRFYSNLNKPSLILHPLPSFSPEKVLSVLKGLEVAKTKSNNQIKILFVTGNPSTKRSNIISPLVEKLAIYKKNINFQVTIIGNINTQIKNQRNLKIFKPNKPISEENLIREYLETDLFISTSIAEGFGIPLLDALLFGINCLATDISSYKEIRQFYGSKNLTLIPALSDIEYYLEKLDYLIENYIYINKKIKYENYKNQYKRIFQDS